MDGVPPLSTSQLLILLSVTFAGGILVTIVAIGFIGHNKRERKPKPLLMTILARYGDVFYDGRYESLSDVEFMKFVRDNTWVFVWMSAEMEYRLRRKVKKDGNYIPKRDKDEQRPDGGKGI